MNLRRVNRSLEKVFKDYGLDFEIKIEDQRLRATNSINMKKYGDGIFADFTFYESGVARYAFVFDKLGKTPTNLDLVNTFNDNVIWFKAFIGDQYLNLVHTAELVTDDDVEEYTRRVFNDLVSDNIYKYLHPITILTTK